LPQQNSNFQDYGVPRSQNLQIHLHFPW